MQNKKYLRPCQSSRHGILSRTDGWNLHANILLLQQPQHEAYLQGKTRFWQVQQALVGSFSLAKDVFLRYS